MSRYFFDVHDNGPPQWDDVGHEFSDDRDIERHVRALLASASARQKEHSTIVLTTTVIVHRDVGGIALTAIARYGRDVQFVWPSS